jgi:phosphinothricin acetyltransferase
MTDRPADIGPVEIRPGTEDDLPGIVEILKYTAANSIASFDTRPVTVGERRGWFGQFADAGPYRLLVAERSSRVAGYACSGRYRDHEVFRETVEVSIALPNDALVALHRKLGFTEVGIFSEYAVKDGQYISSIWMQRRCNPG